jgi:hypothetical protein
MVTEERMAFIVQPHYLVGEFANLKKIDFLTVCSNYEFSLVMKMLQIWKLGRL